MSGLTKDARGFVEGIVDYLKKEGKTTTETTLPKVKHLLTKVSSAARREQEAVVESAVVLTEAEKKELAEALGKLMGHEITLDCSVNERLVAGMRIRIADWVVDTSFAARLKDMAGVLME